MLQQASHHYGTSLHRRIIEVDIDVISYPDKLLRLVAARDEHNRHAQQLVLWDFRRFRSIDLQRQVACQNKVTAACSSSQNGYLKDEFEGASRDRADQHRVQLLVKTLTLGRANIDNLPFCVCQHGRVSKEAGMVWSQAHLQEGPSVLRRLFQTAWGRGSVLGC